MKQEMQSVGKKYPLHFRGTRTILQRQVVHIDNDEALHEHFLSEGKGFRKLAAFLRKQHEERFGEEMKISENSLTCEIYWHYIVQRITLRLVNLVGMNRLFQFALRHTEVIDCGEKKQDNNRFVWDLLSGIWKYR